MYVRGCVLRCKKIYFTKMCNEICDENVLYDKKVCDENV